jgi:hypothetical protein
MADEFIPKMETRYGFHYGRMIVAVELCHTCKKPMVARPQLVSYEHGLFPKHIDENFDAQLKRAGWVEKSHSKVDNSWICEECASQGKASFVCALCNERRTSDQVEERFGDPPEFLCKTCYSSVSALKWDQKTEELNEAHRYDFE